MKSISDPRTEGLKESQELFLHIQACLKILTRNSIPNSKTLSGQNNMGFLVEYSGKLQSILIAVFIIAMSLILWNAGLLGGLRRYGEFGMRLAIGEEKSHVFKTMFLESLIIGFFASLTGLAFGMLIAFYLQEKGVDPGMMMKNASIMMPRVFRAQITPWTWLAGFIPGFISTQIGTMLAGAGISKRQTAHLLQSQPEEVAQSKGRIRGKTTHSLKAGGQ